MHLLHRVAQLDAEPAQNIALPRIVLGIHAGLHLLIVDNTDAERLLCVRRVECRARLLDLREQLLPVRERVAQAVEHEFGLEVPERLELQPFCDVLLELLHLALDQRERTLQRRVVKVCELGDASGLIGHCVHASTYQRCVRCFCRSPTTHLQPDFIPRTLYSMQAADNAYSRSKPVNVVFDEFREHPHLATREAA